ncbi:MAG: permease [Desulfobacterales bacterium]|jgi:uncharacterized membrane protein YraQ (UPF0718 family)
MNTAINVLKRPGAWMTLFLDRVIVLLALALLALFLLDAHQAVQSIRFMGQALLGIAPYFVLAIGFAAYAKASGADQLIARAFSGNTAMAILAGSLAGALSPFCSCGVIPLIAAMLASGVPLAPVMAFCMASPIMDPEMFILTAAGISMPFAIAKTITAIGMGLMAGSTVLGLQKLGYLRQPLKQASGCGCGQPSFDPRASVHIAWQFWQESPRRAAFLEQVRKNGLFLGKWMAMAFFIESLMIAYLPAASVARLVGSANPLAIPLASLVGIPAYMNGYAAIPLISGLLELGMTPGAALAFVTAGAVSSIPAAMAVYALVKRAVFLTYIFLGVMGATIAGVLYQIVTRLQ